MDLEGRGRQAVPELESDPGQAGRHGVAVAPKGDGGIVVDRTLDSDGRRERKRWQLEQRLGIGQLADGRFDAERSAALPGIPRPREEVVEGELGLLGALRAEGAPPPPEVNRTAASTAPLRLPRRGGHGSTMAP
jgi:hypothetical protein